MDNRPGATGTGQSRVGNFADHLRRGGDRIRAEWIRHILDERLLAPLTPDEIEAECRTLYEGCLQALESGRVDALQSYARDFSEHIVPRGVEAYDVLTILPLLRDVFVRELFTEYGSDLAVLQDLLDAYERTANRIVPTLGVSFMQERERVIRQQQDAIRSLSTPVLRVRERLVILPIVGMMDAPRARQLTDQVLVGIRAHRAKALVMDVTGVPGIDASVADHLVRTVDAAQLLGATVILTGVSSEIAQTLTAVRADVERVVTAGDLQAGIEAAERLLGYTLITGPPARPGPLAPAADVSRRAYGSATP